MRTDEEQCAQLYIDLCDASIRKDADGIMALLADDYALVHMTGMRQSARAYVQAVLDGTLNYYTAEHDSIVVDISPCSGFGVARSEFFKTRGLITGNVLCSALALFITNRSTFLHSISTP